MSSRVESSAPPTRRSPGRVGETEARAGRPLTSQPLPGRLQAAAPAGRGGCDLLSAQEGPWPRAQVRFCGPEGLVCGGLVYVRRPLVHKISWVEKCPLIAAETCPPVSWGTFQASFLACNIHQGESEGIRCLELDFGPREFGGSPWGARPAPAGVGEAINTRRERAGRGSPRLLSVRASPKDVGISLPLELWPIGEFEKNFVEKARKLGFAV